MNKSGSLMDRHPIFSIVLIGVCIVVSIPLGALNIALAWNWFVAPILHMQTIGIATAIGLRLFIGALWPQLPPKQISGEKARPVSEIVSVLIGHPLFGILFCVIWHNFA